MLEFAAVLDTKAPGSKFGIVKRCALCHRRHLVWVCFRDLRAVPAGPTAVLMVPTGKTVVTGPECAKKVPIPTYQEHQLHAALEAPALTRGGQKWDKLFNEFR